MSLAVIRVKGKNLYLGKQYNEGYYYSSYTHAEGSFDDILADLSEYVGGETESKITIFESKDAAQEFLDRRHDFFRRGQEGEVVGLFAALDEEGL